MFVFVCAACGAELSVPLSRVASPVHARQKYGNGNRMPVLMAAGTFAVEPGGRGDVVIAPGDVRGTGLVPERRGGACCGLDGADGPNTACVACGSDVATRVDDCSLWQAVWFEPGAVRGRRVGADAAPLSWEELLETGEAIPPFEPIGTWGGRQGGVGHYWSWSPRWEAAAGHALAHMVDASGGRPVRVPNGLVADVFQAALDALLPGKGPGLRAALAGPGQWDPVTEADVLLVPVHPQTGATWAPAGPAASARLVPLALGVWLWSALPEPYPPVPAAGRMPRDVLRDDPLPPYPNRPLWADAETFRRALLRLPAARSPWGRTILEGLARGRFDRVR